VLISGRVLFFFALRHEFPNPKNAASKFLEAAEEMQLLSTTTLAI
jgi:hypothetical protein